MLDAVGPSDSAPLHRLSLRGKKWKYRGEGNANLVIALPSDRLIIRIRKREKGKSVHAKEELAVLRQMWREVVFCCKMMLPLLGRAYIQPPVPARMDKEEVMKLDVALMSQRPVYRHHKGIKFGHVTIYPDYALLPIYLSERNQPLTYHKLFSVANEIHDSYNKKSQINYLRSTSFHDPVFDKNKEAVKILLNISSLYSLHFDEDQNNSSDSNYFPESENVTDASQIGSINRTGTLIDDSDSVIDELSQVDKLSFSPPISSFMKQPSLLNGKNSLPVFPSSRQADYSTYCVELKPKQGWVPMVDRRFSKCTFCLNQYLKLFNGSVKTRSSYCPLDLFSGNRSRMKLAIKALLTTPQNNLKIFRDGHLVYGDETKSDVIDILKTWLDSSLDFFKKDIDVQRLTEKFSELIVDALTRDLTMNESCPKIVDEDKSTEFKENVPERIPSTLISAVSALLHDESCDWSAEDLPPNCIVKRILDIQKLGKYGADTVYDLYKHSYVNELDDYEYVQSDSVLSSSKKLSFDPIQRYLLATTAKDCSILISFQRLHQPSRERIPNCHIIRDSNNEPYVFNIGVSDLDPKPMSCIEKHKKRDCDVISACLKLLSVSPKS